MIIVSTETVEGRPVATTVEGRPVATGFCIVSGKSVMGTNVYCDMFARTSDIDGYDQSMLMVTANSALVKLG
jgi:uncharacterized protein YbjQ (UPF0145 family)